MKRIICLASAMLLVSTLAAAEPKTSDEWYKEGEVQYNLGNLQGAIEAFKKAFALETSESKKWAYMYNIAQAYRFQKDCANARFFYKRYLSLRDQDKTKPFEPSKRAEIEARIKELEDCERKQEAVKGKPPEGMSNDGGRETKEPVKNEVASKPSDGEDGEDGGEGDDGEVKAGTTVGAAPKVISLRAVGGAAKISATDKVNFPVQATGAIFAGFPMQFDKLTLELGAGFTFTPLPYENMPTADAPATDRTAQLIGLVANVGVTYEVIPKLGVRGDLGLGGLIFSGISESLFTNYDPTSGPLSMFHVRLGLSADYAITPNILATVTPIAFSYSPAKDGLRDDIKSLRALDFMVGLGYRM